jgi:hypothetical protein
MPAVVKEQIWKGIGYDPHDGQRMIHQALVRHRLAACGRRFGKSTVGGNELIPEAVYAFSIRKLLEEQSKKRRFWIVGPDYSDTEKEFRVLYDHLKRLEMPFDKPGTYNNPLGGFMHISLWDGLFQVHCKSARHPESLDGEGLVGVELVEAAKLKPLIFNKYIRPALADESGWSLMTSTPEGKNWFYRLWQVGQDPNRPHWKSWRMPSWKNLRIFPGGRNDPEILEMAADMSEERFNQEIGADFSDFVGRVFKDFDEELHVTDCPYNPDLPIFLAVDYGWTNPFVVLGIQVDVFDNVYVCGEYRMMNRDTTEVAADLKQIPWARAATDLYPDPAEPDDTNILANTLRLRVHKNTGGELKHRLELIRNRMKYDPLSEGHPDEIRKPKLFIDRSCIGNPIGDGGLIREMQDYRFPDTKEESMKSEPEMPLKKDDHGPEALGRFFKGYYGGPGEGKVGRAKMRKVVIRSGRS